MVVAALIPCRNEAATIARLLTALLAQQRRPDRIVVVDDRSTDRSAAVVQDWANTHPELPCTIVAGPGRGVPAAVNTGIAAAESADIIVRLDGHSAPDPTYIARALSHLQGGDRVVVGGVWRIEPGADTRTARAIAAAVAHPLGSGGAAYRDAGAASDGPIPVETVPFGVFTTALWRELGGFDEALLANEDYDFNYRARRAGATVLLDGAMQSVYRARATFGALARQYHHYGVWKAVMLRKDVRSLHPRQAAAAAILPWVVATTVFALMHPVPVTLAGAAAYPAILGAGGFAVGARAGDARLAPAAAVALAITQLCWSAGFLRGCLGAGASRRSDS